MITGFRLGPAGAQGRYGITPDLSMFGKVAGGGLPLAAVGGTADVMDQLAPLGPVYQAGTLSGNPLATAAGLAVLDELTDDSYTDPREPRPRASPTASPKRSPTHTSPESAPSPASSSPTDPVTNYEQAQQADHARYARLFHHLLARGHFLAPSGYETLFVSLAHEDEQIDETVAAAASSRPRSERRGPARRSLRSTVRTPGGPRRSQLKCYCESSSCGRRLRRTWSMKNSEPPMATTITTMSTKARPPEPSPSFPASTSC